MQGKLTIGPAAAWNVNRNSDAQTHEKLMEVDGRSHGHKKV